MKCLSRWLNGNSYESLLWLESESMPGVEFSLRKISLAQRIDLAARVRDISRRNEFLKAGPIEENMEAALADFLVEKLYVEWAVSDIRGLKIDGRSASVGLLLQHGPEALVHEMADAIKQHLQLSETERKNF